MSGIDGWFEFKGILESWAYVVLVDPVCRLLEPFFKTLDIFGKQLSILMIIIAHTN